ncbi:MAG TPA: NAD-dependent epimerase/dehydratase family protein [Solirubrobacteraceae bacterium]|jgi:UDP-glucose 4-epimerase
MRVLVTGGAGFIGSHVVDRLLAAGHRPSIFDLRSSPYHDRRRVPAVAGDLSDLDRLTKAMDGCDVVIHLAAAADVGEVEKAPLEAEARNARGTAHVLEAARRAEVKRVVYASTIWVYSDAGEPMVDESVALRPPAHFYTATKLAGELYCRSYRELYGLEYTVLRFGIPYGPRARPAAVVPTFVGKALAGEPLTVAGDGRQSRRFVYVEDLAEGVVKALCPTAADRVYNLVGSEDVTIAEIAETVRELVGDVEIKRVPGRNGDFAGAAVSGERAARELGWEPQTPFREGVRRYIDWHRASEEPQPEPSRAPLAVSLLRRAVVAVALAAIAAALGIGVATVAPVDPDMDPQDTFVALLTLLVPLLLAGGFDWDARHRRWLQTAFWALAVGTLAVLVLPWPPLLDHLGHGHPVFLGLTALSAAAAARMAGSRPGLPAWLAPAGD